MISVTDTLTQFQEGKIDKPTFIKTMYEAHHAVFFDYAAYLPRTNVKKIEVEDGRVIMTSRDRGIRIACTPGDYRVAPMETLNFFDYEKEESDMMEKLVADGDNFFDIGANIGWYSINIAASRRATTVYAFEPIPDTYERLQTNLALNATSNIKPFNFGLSDQPGEFTFYYPAEGSGNASAVNLTGRGDVRTAQCTVRTLDAFAEETGVRVDFIKCDVEGAELLVFKGGHATIARDKPIVLAEILRKWSAQFGYSPNEIFTLFRALGYEAYTSNGGRLQPFGTMDENTIPTNFFFLHREKHAELLRQHAVQA
ncbi:FkbM family methyltransferase [Massilia endophytica]|uniref:FkbM family methyltransferase n=1 Tax=Massilia endophytica TaxID=2899220 RepID=UPI001E3442AD|nr:FkbM family methyltransferase [Massilia endophytica]UGQ46608.1 FkbM family methyltransferase [Massilia endophytica]